MANKTITQLPEQTGKTDNDLLAIVDSGETVTSKIKVSTLLAGTGGEYIAGNGTNTIIPSYYDVADITGTGNTIAGGDTISKNTITNTNSNNNFIGGGTNNTIDNEDSAIVGGINNTINPFNSTVLGGSSVIVGGSTNTANYQYNFIAGGTNNAVGGGGYRSNSIVGSESCSTTSRNNLGIYTSVSSNISGGGSQYSSILGGSGHNVSGSHSSVVGGQTNTITANNSVIAGGANNSISLNANFIGASSTTTIGNAQNSSIIASSNSTINNGSGSFSVIIGGTSNIHGSVSRGRNNGIYSSRDSSIIGTGGGFYDSQFVILGGNNNTVTHSGTYPNMTTIGGQTNSITDATNGVIIGGQNHTLSGHSNSVIIGGSGFTSNHNDEVIVPALTIANYASLNFSGDTAAATGGVPLGGVYHDNGQARIRIT